MPHQCTTCGRTFPDGSKEMLSGCPDCGGNKFQFKPAGATADEGSTPAEQSSPTSDNRSDQSDDFPSTDFPSTDSQSTDSPSTDPQSTDSPSTNPAEAAATDDSAPSDSTPADAGPADSDTERAARTDPADSTSTPPDESTGTEHVNERSEEDVAQASTRSDVVSPDELDRASRPVDSESGADRQGSADPDAPRPDIGKLRDELNEQFESIRIVSPGKYELNLMELYDRQEYIISLQEDGRYVIEMPDAWGIQDE
ncbi:OapC/ArvC family zinc-ribbon domain-containing protein [Halorubrum yunnanense]|uniref:Zn-ribbon containing protein n=1 Tax=Halorubrum yunnanense TaxID=1526162 RepID=A0ABD5YEJ2_9EURY|nr:Zn-ribbon containing protein [Halorubrum yunnanense]